MLGTKEIIKRDKNDKYLNDLERICKKATIPENWVKNNFEKEFFMRIFSDNILFAFKSNENDAQEKEKHLIIKHILNYD